MKLFIDCEWNDYKGQLISMALVPLEGEPFYEVLHCAQPSEWIAKNVMPVLNKKPIRALEFESKLESYLAQFPMLEVIADWPEDIQHFCDFLIVGPGRRIGPAKMIFEVSRFYRNDESTVLHNALEDAKAIRDSYLAIQNT